MPCECVSVDVLEEPDAGPGLQHEKGNQHSGRWWFDGGDPGIGSPRGVPTCQPQSLRFYTVWTHSGRQR